jgi:trypsin
MTRTVQLCFAAAFLAASPCEAAPLIDERVKELLAELTASARTVPFVVEYDLCPSKVLTQEHRLHVSVPLQLSYQVSAAQISVTSTSSAIQLGLPALHPEVAARPAAFQQDPSDALTLNAAEASALVAQLDVHTTALGTYFTANGGDQAVAAAAANELAAALTQRIRTLNDTRTIAADLTAPARAQIPMPDVQLCNGAVLTPKFPGKFAQEQFLARGAVLIPNAAGSDAGKLREYLKNAAGKAIAYRELSGTTSAPIGNYKALQLPTGATAPIGASGEKVINGTFVAPGDMPWSAAFMTTAQDGKREAFCGGSLIAEKWVLTAAHCAIPDGTEVIIGRNDLSASDGIKRRVKTQWRHIDFGRAALYDSDIALVELSASVTAPPATLGSAAPAVSSRLIVAGWGATEEGGRSIQLLSFVDLNIDPQDTCVRRYKFSNAPVTENMFCASKSKPRPQDACQGDSGGGSFSKPIGAGYELVGIVSFGKGCATPGFPGVYTKLAPFRPWLAEVQQATGVQ